MGRASRHGEESRETRKERKRKRAKENKHPPLPFNLSCTHDTHEMT